MSESYDVGTRAWQPDTTEGWVASEVINKSANGDKISLVFQLENGEVSYTLSDLCPGAVLGSGAMADPRSIYLQTKTVEVSAEGLHSGNDPNLPPLMNPTILEASDDLTNLSHLNEPAGEHRRAVLTLWPAFSNT